MFAGVNQRWRSGPIQLIVTELNFSQGFLSWARESAYNDRPQVREVSEPAKETESADDLDPAEAFSLLGDDVRIEIIAVLAEDTRNPLPFSELHERVGLADSGQFNYHLSKLVGQFVSKSDEGYELTVAGDRLARAIKAGLYTTSPAIEPFDVDGTCIECSESSLQASYADEKVTITCSACGHEKLKVSAPPSLFRGRDPAEALDAFEQWSFQRVKQAVSGICPFCGGPITKGITEQTADHITLDVLPEMTCTVCDHHVLTTFEAIARRDPTVESFYDQHNLHLQSKHYWEGKDEFTEQNLERISADPFRMQVTFEADGHICTAEIDDSLTVVKTVVRRADE